jgi:hypothetical protein
MKRVGCCLFTVLSLLARVRSADAEWVVGGFLGWVATSQSYLAVTQPASRTNVRFDPVDYKGRSFNLPLYYGYRAAYFPGSPGWFGIEGEVIHMKAYAQTGDVASASGVVGGVPVAVSMPISNVVQRFSLSHGQNMLLVNAVVRHAFGGRGDYRTARLVALARVGAGPTLPHAESTIGGVADERYERGALVGLPGGWRHRAAGVEEAACAGRVQVHPLPAIGQRRGRRDRGDAPLRPPLRVRYGGPFLRGLQAPGFGLQA